MGLRVGRAWLDIDWEWGRSYVEAYRNDRTFVLTIGPFGLMAGWADPMPDGGAE